MLSKNLNTLNPINAIVNDKGKKVELNKRRGRLEIGSNI